MESVKEIKNKHLGLVRYNVAWKIQNELFNELLENKQKGIENLDNYLITCEHNHVITLGKSGDESNLIHPEFKGVDFVKTDRGGDITYHGPGQLVVYPIIDLEVFNISLREYIYLLEQSVIDTLDFYGIKSDRIKEYTGIWIDSKSSNPRKIAAIGVKSSRYITMHGLALNISTDLKYFDLIIPCGITGKGVTSIEKEIKNKIEFEEVREMLIKIFTKLL